MSLQTVFDNFALLADAPNGVRRLRELILDLAVLGNLATQWPTDESASTLLEKILGGNQARALSQPETPFRLPDNWLWVRFGDLYDIQGGTQPPKSEFAPSPRDGYVRLLQIRDFGQRPDPVYIKKNSVKSFCTTSDVMLARYGASVGKVFMGQDGAYNVALTKIIFNHEFLYNRFVFYLLKSSLFQDWLRPMSRSAQAGFNKGNIHPIPLPLAPHEEQKRIVAKVDELMRLCDELEARRQARRESRVRLNNATLAPLNNAASLAPEEFEQASVRLADNFASLYDSAETVGKLRSMILQLAVQGKLVPQSPHDEPASDWIDTIKKRKAQLIKEKAIKKEGVLPSINPDELPYSLPTAWQWARIEEISDVGTGSTPLSSNTEYYYQGTIAWITSAATSQEYIYDADTRVTPKAVTDYRLRLYPIGTLVIALYGQGKTRGQISQLKITATINQACAALSLIENSEQHSCYVRRFFEKAYEELRALAAGGAQPNLNLRKIKETLIPLPPLEEQKRIVAKVNQLMALCDELEIKLSQAEADSEKLMNNAVQHVLDTVAGKVKSQRENALALSST